MRAAGRELIPAAIIDKPPSAELAPGQKDTDSLPPYDVLDEILKMLIEGARLGRGERDAGGERSSCWSSIASADGRALIARVKQHDRAQRIQAPPGAAHPARARARFRQRAADADRRASTLERHDAQNSTSRSSSAASRSCTKGTSRCCAQRWQPRRSVVHGHRLGLARARCAQSIHLARSASSSSKPC